MPPRLQRSGRGLHGGWHVGVASGVYAVSVFHDENGNGKLDTGFMGIPSEGFGASNDAPEKFGPPKYADARFAVTGDQTLTVHMKAVRDPHVKISQFNPAFETSRQRVDDAGAQDRLRPRDHDPDAYNCHGKKDHQDSEDPAPSARTFPAS